MNKMPEHITAWMNKGRGYFRETGEHINGICSDTGISVYIRSDVAYPERCGDNSTRCVNIAVTKEAAREALEAIGSISYNRDCNPCPPLSMHKTIKTLLEAAAQQGE